MNPFLRTAYNYNMNEAGDESGLNCKDPTLTQQHFKEEVDINTLVERFHITGEMPQLEKLPSYDDYTGVFDFQTAMNAIVAAKKDFDSLPAKTRARFGNDPQEFVSFFADPTNRAEAEKMGMIEKVPPAPTPEELAAARPATKADLQEAFKVTQKQGDTPKTP